MEELKQRIITAATGLFLQHGPKSITMDQVSVQCGISKRTLYENFSDKNQLLQLCLDLLNQEQKIIREQLARESGNVIAYLVASTKQAIEASYRFNPNFFIELRRYYPKVARYQDQVSDAVFNQELMNIIEKGKTEGLFREETNVKLVVELLKVQLEAIYYSDLLTKNNLTLNEVFHTVIFTFMRGIATPEGLKVISAYKPE